MKRLLLANVGFVPTLLLPALASAHPGHGPPGQSPMMHLLTQPQHAVGIYLAIILGVGCSWFMAARDRRRP